MGPEAGGTAHLQSQGEGEAANPHRPVPQGFEPWTFGSKVQYPTPELPAPLFGVHVTMKTKSMVAQPCIWFVKTGISQMFIKTGPYGTPCLPYVCMWPVRPSLDKPHM